MKIIKRLIGAFVVFSLIIGVIPALDYSQFDWANIVGTKVSAASIQDQYGQAEHIKSVPSGYQGIWSAIDLLSLARSTSGNYILMQDIDASGYFYPSFYFSGIIDGNGYTISNYNCTGICDVSYNYGMGRHLGTGFVGCLLSNGTIKNLTLENAFISSSCENIGGLVGTMYPGATIENCKITGTLYAASDAYAGGLVGIQVGFNTGSSRITNCYSSVSIKGSTKYSGGIVGFIRTGNYSSTHEINDCFANSLIEDSNCAGGIVGTIDCVSFARAVVNNCFSTSQFNNCKMFAGICSLSDESDFNNCFYANANTAFISMTKGKSSKVVLLSDSQIKSGTIPAHLNDEPIDGYIGLWSADDLLTLGNLTGENYDLMCDIDARGRAYGSHEYSGNFEGNGHTISNYTCRGICDYYPNNYGYSHYVGSGFIGCLLNGKIKNLSLKDINVLSDCENVGGLVGLATRGSFIENCSVSGTITINNESGAVGGLIGCEIESSIINYSFADVVIKGNSCYAGGLIGKVIHEGHNFHANIADSYSKGIIENAIYSGGIVGSIQGGLSSSDREYIINNCFSLMEFKNCKNCVGIFYDSSIRTICKNLYYCYSPKAFGTTNSITSEKVQLYTIDKFSDKNNFPGYDFKDIWELVNNRYPTHQANKIRENNSDYYLKLLDLNTKEGIGNACVRIGTETFIASHSGGVRIPVSIVKSQMSTINGAVQIDISEGTHKKLSITNRDLAPGTVTVLYLESLTAVWGINTLFEDALSNVQTIDCKIQGPKVDYFGEEQPLFSVSGGIDLSELKTMLGSSVSLKTQMDTRKKVLKVIGGLKTSGLNLDSDMDYSADDPDNKFNSWYSQICNFTHSEPGTDKNGLFKKLYNNLEQSEGTFGFKVNVSYLAYAQFDYSTGKLVLQEGGFSVIISAGVSADYPVCATPPIYLTFKLTGELEGKLKLSLEKADSLDFSGSLSAALKPSIGVGIGSKYIVAGEIGIDGTISISVNFPYKSFDQSVSAYLSAQAYFQLTALKVFSKKWSTNYPRYILLPSSESGFEHTNKSKKQVKTASVSYDDFELIDRDYLEKKTKSRSNNAFNSTGTITELNVYDNGSPKLISLQNGSVLAVWVYDDGSKSTSNCTTLYYSLYQADHWTKPEPIFESGRADMDIVMCTDGKNVFAVWQRCSEIMSEEVTLSEMLQKTELVFSEFNGEQWSTPSVIDAAGHYQAFYSVCESNGQITVSWAEAQEEYNANSKMTIFSKSYQNEAWEEAITIDERIGVTSLAVGYAGDYLSYAYCVDEDGDFSTSGDSELYINSQKKTDDALDDLSVTYQNGTLYWLKNGELYSINGDDIHSLGYSVKDNYIVIDQNHILTTLEDGYKNELVCYSNGLTTAIPLSNYGNHIRSFGSVLLNNGGIMVLQSIANLNEDNSNEPYNTTDMILDVYTDFTDLAIGADVYYDLEKVKPDEAIDLQATVYNRSLSRIDSFIAYVYDGDTVLSSTRFEGELSSGEAKEITIPCHIPANLNRKTLKIQVDAPNDRDSSNNNTSFNIGYADIAIIDYAISEEGILSAKVVNKGYESAQGISLQISKLINEFEPLTDISIGQLNPGESYTLTYSVGNNMIAFRDETTIHHFAIKASSEAEEINTANNSIDIWVQPTRVSSVVLSDKYLNLDVGEETSITVEVLPSDAFNKKTVWLSSDEYVANVDSLGHVIARNSGTAIITAISEDGVKYDECRVVVNEKYHTVKYFVDDEVYSEYQVAEGHPVPVPNDPIKNGHVFVSWTPEIPDQLGANDLTFKASWTPKSYSVFFDANGGAFSNGESLKEVQTQFNELPRITDSPILENKVFLGWTPQIQAVDGSNLQYVANWGDVKENVYYATFVADGTVVAVVPFLDGQTTIEEPPVPTKQCTVARWGSYSLDNSDLTIKAEYTIQHHIVKDDAVTPTCVACGQTEGSHCRECGQVIVMPNEVEPLGHDYDALITTPTCDTIGFTTYTCQRCGYCYIGDEKAARGHAWDDSISKEATCNDDGLKTFTCKYDATHTYTELIPALGHDYKVTVVAPTCAEGGHTLHACIRCNDNYITDENVAIGHAWDSGRITKTATCTEDGVRTFTCTHDSSHTKTEPIPAKGHAYEAVITAPTCTEKGFTTYTCSACGDHYTADEKPATGHSFGAWIQTKAPTVYAEGEEQQTCSKCDEKNTKSIPKLPMPKVVIQHFTASSKAYDYRSSITFKANADNKLPSGQIHWFVDGKEVATGDTYTAENVKQGFSLQAKYYVDGKEIPEAATETEKVNVNTGFFAKLKAFFRSLFGLLPKVTQEYLGIEIIDRILPD